MGRLVVARVLPGDSDAVLRVVHEGGDAVRGRNGGGVEAKVRAVFGSPDHFFAPVADEVGRKSRGCLGAVV